MNEVLDDKNLIAMKLLHYFITEKNYNPIILQGADNEIWLENMDSDYKIIRIVSNHIHNSEQFEDDEIDTINNFVKWDNEEKNKAIFKLIRNQDTRTLRVIQKQIEALLELLKA